MEQNKHRGLTENEVRQSREKHGSNEILERKTKGFIGQFIENLGDPMIRVLLIALGLNIVVSHGRGSPIESLGIGAAVMVATLVSTVSEYGSSLAFRKLQSETANRVCRVIRGGDVREITESEIVVGDVVMLESGDMIPSDGRLIDGALGVDQSALTGESDEKSKLPTVEPSEKSKLYRGSLVASGEGIMCTEAVGRATYLGRMADELQEDSPDSPLKLRLTKLAKQISVIGYIAAVLVASADLVNQLIVHGGIYTLTAVTLVEHLLHALTLGLTVVVVAVPEGLPMMITVVLSSNMLRMQRDKVMVKKLVGIETAGSLNILFCDKTGTMTKGKLDVTEIFTADGRTSTDLKSLDAEMRELFAISMTLNSSSVLSSDGSPSGGNATDRALLKFAAKSSVAAASYRRIDFTPFDSKKKYSSANVTGKRTIGLIKGAPEKLLGLCTTYHAADGTKHPLDTAHRAKLEAALSRYTQKACRVLAFCTTDGRVDSGMKNLTFLGFASLRDELRPGAKRAVGELKRAGIIPVMITGDNRETASVIARELGILDREGRVITSDELKQITDHELKELLPTLRVVARALPSDKSRLVKGARDAGLVSAMTGDGVNDAPALRCADVGFAMGSGTSVAKEAGDIVITDNNIASIVKAVLYGRTVFKSIRRFIVFQLTMNFSAVLVSLICPFLCGIETPVTVMQMLWINIIMDTLAGLAFAGESPQSEYMSEKPKAKSEPILSRRMVGQIVWGTVSTVALCVYFLMSPRVNGVFRSSPDDIYWLTGFFALFVFCGVFNSFCTRTPRLNLFASLSRNPTFALISLLIVGVQLGLVFFGGAMFRCTPLTWAELGTTIVVASCVIPLDLIRKSLLRIVTSRSHGVEDRKHRDTDIGKDGEPHVRQPKRRENQKSDLDDQRKDDILRDDSPRLPRDKQSIA